MLAYYNYYNSLNICDIKLRQYSLPIAAAVIFQTEYIYFTSLPHQVYITYMFLISHIPTYNLSSRQAYHTYICLHSWKVLFYYILCSVTCYNACSSSVNTTLCYKLTLEDLGHLFAMQSLGRWRHLDHPSL